MPSDKWLAMGVAAGMVGVAALGGAYLLFRHDGDSESSGHLSSRPVKIEVKIPRDQVGTVIGRGGQTIKEIQSKSGTRINFMDELETEEYRVARISGLPDDVQLAEILIHQTMMNQPMFESLVMYVPSVTVGKIIGRNGDMIRSLTFRSKCRIDVQRGSSYADDRTGKTEVKLKGTYDQVHRAKEMIEEIVDEEWRRRQKTTNGSFDAAPPPKRQEKQQLFLTADEADDGLSGIDPNGKAEQLVATSTSDANIEVYVSSLSDPGHFFVQKVGPQSVALDKLVQEMTAFYEADVNKQSYSVEKVDAGDLVAVQYSSDNSWYRARVVKVDVDDYDESKVTIDVDFVDFGDCETKQLSSACELKQEFLRLNFQAIPVTMAYIKPKTNDWSTESADDFEQLTHAAQWKSLLARVVRMAMIDGELIPAVELVDTNCENDVNIGEELVRRGHACYFKTDC